MDRREFIGAVAATGLVAAAPLQAQTPIRRKNRIKQALWRIAFGDDTKLSFDDQCREAARLGAHGFDLIGTEDWPTMRKHGLKPTLAPTGGVDFPNGIIHPEVHDKIEASLRQHIDLCAKNDVRTIITVGGQRRGMAFEQAAENAARFLNRIKGQLEQRNVTLAIENMNNRRTDPRYGREDQVFGHWDWGIALCERVNSPNVKIVCDLYHLQIMDGDIVERLKAHQKWIAHIHVAGVPSRNQIDATQELNYRYIAETIANLPGWNGYVAHEWRPAPGLDPIKTIEAAMELMDV